MTDFIDKKEKLADLLEGFMINPEMERELLDFVNELLTDVEFNRKDLFRNLLNEFQNYLSELSRKELKQRVLMIRSFIE